MSGRGPIPPPEPPEFDPVRVNPIEKDKKIKEEFPQKEFISSEKREAIFLYALFKTLIKCLGKIFPKENRAKTIPIGDQVLLAKHLGQLKDMFVLMREQDMSQNSHYAQRLTECWNNLLLEYEAVRNVSSPNQELRKSLRTMMAEIDAYPPLEDHSLGYYLTHFAGEKWLPFPFISILQLLHEKHLEDPQESDLNHLIDRIEDCLKFFRP